MENKIWEKNLEALEKMLPEWTKYIEEYQEESEIEIKVSSSYSGEKISIVKSEDREYYLSGKYNPQGLAKHWIKDIKNVDFGTVVLLIGFSDGRVLRELVDSVSEDTVILVYEPSIDIFIHTMKEYEVADIFQEHTIVLVIEGINGMELKPIIERAVVIENMFKLVPVIQGNYEKLFYQQVKEAIGVLNKRVEDLRFYWNTLMTFTNETIINNIKNFKYLYQHYSLNALYQTLPKDVPVIIVGAGPSLDKNIDLLTEVKGKACIIACDTALKPLLRRGIIPDFFVVVDPRKPLELFDDARVQQIPLIASLNIPYQVMCQHKGKKVVYFDTALMLDLLEFVFGEEKDKPEHDMDSLPTGGSVATSAFSAARLMGAKTIVLIGQDLALSKEKEHAEGTFEKDRTFDLQNESLPLVESIEGEKIPTLHNLKIYLEWFEERIKQYPDIKVVDATEGGALIHGSEILTLQEAIESYCMGSFCENEYWNKIKPHFDEKAREKALLFMKKIPEQLKELEEQVVQGKELYEKLEKCAEKEDYSLKEAKELLAQIKEISDSLEKNRLAMFISEGLRGVEYTLRVTAYQFEDDEQKNLIEGARAGWCFLESLEIAINEVRPEIIKLSEFEGSYE